MASRFSDQGLPALHLWSPHSQHWLLQTLTSTWKTTGKPRGSNLLKKPTGKMTMAMKGNLLSHIRGEQGVLENGLGGCSILQLSPTAHSIRPFKAYQQSKTQKQLGRKVERPLSLGTWHLSSWRPWNPPDPGDHRHIPTFLRRPNAAYWLGPTKSEIKGFLLFSHDSKTLPAFWAFKQWKTTH